MMRVIQNALNQWAKDESIKAVLVEGSGRAFCAGGDLKRLLQEADGGRTYISTEYRMDSRVHYFRKPYVALWHGIVMGGGAGLTVCGSYRIATEHTQFAMPEVKAGFFPDVGCSYFLSRCPGAVGMYLALTGNTISGLDAMYARLATHFVPAMQLPLLKEKLLRSNLQEGVLSIIERFSVEPKVEEESSLAKLQPLIDRCFLHANSIEEALKIAKRDCGEWGTQLCNEIRARCPVSVKVSFEMLKRAQMLPFSDCIRMEFRIAMRILANPINVREGVRAVLVDRDNKPKWIPATVEEVSDEVVGGHLAAFEDPKLELFLGDLLNEQ